MRKTKLSFRVDDQTLMQLGELAVMMDTKVSFIIRMLLRKSLNEITDSDGNLSIQQYRKALRHERTE